MSNDAPDVPTRGWREDEVEQLIGRLLQVGVLVAAAVVMIGGIMLLVQHGNTPVEFRTFSAAASPLEGLVGIFRGCFALDSRSIVQLGLVLLIATPVMRVALTLVTFALQRDRLYVLITSVVLLLLLYGLIWGRA